MIDKKKLVERTKRYEQSEKGRARRKRYYEKNREKILAQQKLYNLKKTHPESYADMKEAMEIDDYEQDKG